MMRGIDVVASKRHGRRPLAALVPLPHIMAVQLVKPFLKITPRGELQV